MPNRIQLQFNLAISAGSNYVFIGGNFHRIPENSTIRYTNWANSMDKSTIRKQIYTSHGPTLVAPTWFITRKLYDKVGGFHERLTSGFPEDLHFFYKALDVEDVVFDKVSEDVVMYRYHSGCSTFAVDEKSIWDLRIERIRKDYLEKWSKFTIWSAGKQGKRFFKSLNESEKEKVIAFGDIDESKIRRGLHEEFNEKERRITHRIPIIDIKKAVPPLVVCVKLDLTNGDLEKIINEQRWREHDDLVYFS
ncbi:unnamed protein product [Caenorhabditis bovis]|uniref:Uncharacterized protein n=1 Tax=Caenorhabditis bovis TaxID=2654633 RepID=A0A8S1F572_9PELO|nr:unnamed protein product [Caenorhabditis bovis]